LTISSAAAFMSSASATVRWCFMAANRVIIRSVMHSRQTAICQRIGASLSGHPTTASVGPPPQNVHWWIRSHPTAFHRRWPGVRLRSWRSDMRAPLEPLPNNNTRRPRGGYWRLVFVPETGVSPWEALGEQLSGPRRPAWRTPDGLGRK
jgi:hypothetical protein